MYSFGKKEVMVVFSAFIVITLFRSVFGTFSDNPLATGINCTGESRNLRWVYDETGANPALIVEWKQGVDSVLTWVVTANSYTYGAGYSVTKVSHDNTNGEITLLDLTTTNSGTYICEVTYTLGSVITSQSHILTVFDYITIFNCTFQTGMIDCQISDHTVPVQVNGTTRSLPYTPPSSGTYEVCMTGDAAICSSVPQCQIVDVGSSDTDSPSSESGLLTWLIPVVIAVIVVIILVIYVLYRKLRPDIKDPLTIKATKTFYSCRTGTTLVLQCTVTGRPTVIIWFHNDIRLYKRLNNRLRNGNKCTPSLTIRNVQLTDGGQYYCRAEDSTGLNVRTNNITVDIQAVHVVVHVIGIIGESFTFRSPDGLTPIVNVEWHYKDKTGKEFAVGGPDYPLENRAEIVRENGKCYLKLSDLQETDEGTYTCSDSTRKTKCTCCDSTWKKEYYLQLKDKKTEKPLINDQHKNKRTGSPGNNSVSPADKREQGDGHEGRSTVSEKNEHTKARELPAGPKDTSVPQFPDVETGQRSIVLAPLPEKKRKKKKKNKNQEQTDVV